MITPLPTPPSRTSPNTFSTLADAFLGALPTFATEANALQTDVNAKQVIASDAAAASEISAIAALGHSQQAAAEVVLASQQVALAQAAASSAGSIAWVSGTTYAVGDLRYSPIDFQNYRRKVAGAGTIDPSLDTINWVAAVDSKPSLVRSVRTSNTSLGTSDIAKLIDITSGTFTQTFVAAATLGDGWFCYIKNSGAGDITLDPDAAETIDGLTSFVMYPGEVRLLQCDGVALRSVVLNSFYRTFTASGTFTKPPGYSAFEGFLWAGGGSGCKNNTVQYKTGGAGGGCAPFTFSAAALAASETVTIGAGGAAVTVAGNGNAGGNSTLGSLVSSFGGTGGQSNSGYFQITGGAAYFNATADNPAYSPSTNNAPPSGYLSGGGADNNARKSVYGGASGGGFNNSTAGNLGTSVFGGNGGAGGASASGTAGTAPAGGGGATLTGATSGAGARGELRIWGLI